MNTKRTVVVIAALLISCAIYAQRDYSTGFGVRLGTTNGITVKHFVTDHSALEGILSTRWRGFIITGLYEFHLNAFKTPNFNFYYGFGGHLGVWSVYGYNHPWFEDDDEYIALGVDGILGLEYTFDEVPFSVALDWKPALNLIEITDFWIDDIGLSIRYVIK